MFDAAVNLQQVKFSPATLIDEAAGEIVRRFADGFPDLSCLTVLLPNVHAVAGFKHAIRRAVNRDVLLLPRFGTLSTLVETVSLERPVAPSSLRLVQIYSALKEGDWFDQASLWEISAELARLFDELTLSQQNLPEHIDDFILFLERSYGAKSDASMRFEARLVHEMWFAFNRAELSDRESSLTAATAYALQLATVAQEARGPLCVVDIDHLAPAEVSFLRLYAQRQPVLVINADGFAADSLSACLATAWAGSGEGELRKDELRQRAAQFSQIYTQSPLQGRLKLYGAVSLEDEAAAVVRQIEFWLAEGKRNIALLAIDRLVARRVRALLERYNVLLADESGWTLSTTSASTVIMRLLDVVGDGFYHRDVLDLAKSPFFAADWIPERRKRAVHRLEQWVREHNIVAGFDRYRELAMRHRPGDDEEVILSRLERVYSRLKAGKQTLGDWIERLIDSLRDLGATQALQADLAGRQLMKLLTRRRQELAGHAERVSLTEWRRWLNAELESQVFRDDAIVSPVILTSLPATRLREFDAAIVIGADATHLGMRPPAVRLFNQAVRRDLGLPGVKESAVEIQENLAGVLVRSCAVLVTWQASKDGDHNAMSPWFARLEAFHNIAYGESLRVHPAETSNIANTQCAHQSFKPAPIVPPGLLPTRISASAYASLMACPYQFFARHVLSLNQQDEVAEEMEKRDFGKIVHEVLACFHQEYPIVSVLAEDVAEIALKRITDTAFRDLIKNNYVCLAWKFRWEKRIPLYLAWHRQREAEGWLFHAAEKKFERKIAFDPDGEVMLHGRIDRIDRHAAEECFAVLDYKTQSKKKLAEKLELPGEDVQLAVYAVLLGEDDVADGAYVSLDDKQRVDAVSVGQTLPEIASDVGNRLSELFNGMSRGESLAANASPGACQYCEMRGLCRLDYWNGES